MKVVKCLLEIPKELWGKVIEDGIGGFESRDGIGISYQLKPSDTFPLPTQGDKVKATQNGTMWFDTEYRFYDELDKVFVVKVDTQYVSALYIRLVGKPLKPVVKENNSVHAVSKELLKILDFYVKEYYKKRSSKNEKCIH